MLRMIRELCGKKVENDNGDGDEKTIRTKSKVSFVLNPEEGCKENLVAIEVIKAIQCGAQDAIRGNLEASKGFSRTFSDYSFSGTLSNSKSVPAIMLHGDNSHNDPDSDG